jgi:Mobilization protein NikA
VAFRLRRIGSSFLRFATAQETFRLRRIGSSCLRFATAQETFRLRRIGLSCLRFAPAEVASKPDVLRGFASSAPRGSLRSLLAFAPSCSRKASGMSDRRTGVDSRRVVIRPVRYSPTEWDAVRELAATAGKPPATYVREAALGVVLRRRLSAVDQAVLYELARVGNNLNQIAKALNAGDLTAAVDVTPALRELQGILRSLRA